MAEVVLKAERRSVIGKQVKALRRQGIMPAVLYGHGFEPIPVQLNLHETSKILSYTPSSALITIDLEGEKHMAVVREKQYNYIRRELKHMDFQVVSMLEKLRVSVPVELVGISSAIETYHGVIFVNQNTLEIECLPGDLPEHIEVDLSTLVQIGDSIVAGSIKVSDKLAILNDPNQVIVVVTGQRAEEIVPEAISLEPEVIEKGKKEEEEV